jgi:hypothetical protein
MSIASRKRLVLLTCAISLVAVPALANAESFNYADEPFFTAWQDERTDGVAQRQFNKVWRPIGTQFKLYYTDGEFTFEQYNTYSNPFVDPTGGIGCCFYAGCANWYGGVVGPVTCQTTRPSAPAPVVTASRTPLVAGDAAGRMNTLSRPETATDRAAGLAARDVIAALTDTAGAPPGMAPGRPIAGTFCILAANLGPEGEALYAFRTDRGRVCGGLLGHAAGCFTRFEQGNSINWTVDHSSDGRTVVFGFVPDDVRSVRVLLDGVAREMTLTGNGFFLELRSTPLASLTALEATLAGGGTERVPLNLSRRPSS